MARSVTLDEYKWVLLTVLLTMFFSWALQEVMERGFGMAPNITKATDIHTKAKKVENPMKHYRINRMLTKSLDIKGQFRIQTRGTIYFIKSIYQFFLFLASLTIFISFPEWFKDHFIHLKEDTVWFMPYLHISASLVAFYAWEVIANRYGRLTWSVLVHHWFTAGIAVAILLGRYTPFATWYGFCLVSMDFPVFFTLGFRAQFSNKYPVFTRRAFIFSFFWWLFIIILNLGGQIFIILNSLIYHFNESIHVAFIGVMLLCIAAWLYDDLMLLRSLYDFSTHDYEDAEILNSDNRSLSRNMGGRALFAMSVLHDIDQVKQKSTEPSSNLGPPDSQRVLKNVTLHQMSSDPYFDPHDTHEKDAKLEKHESLTDDDLHEIRQGVEAETPKAVKLTKDAEQIQLRPMSSSGSPGSDAHTAGSPTSEMLHKLDGLNSGDLADLMDVQKEVLQEREAGTANDMAAMSTEHEIYGLKSSRL